MLTRMLDESLSTANSMSTPAPTSSLALSYSTLLTRHYTHTLYNNLLRLQACNPLILPSPALSPHRSLPTPALPALTPLPLAYAPNRSAKAAAATATEDPEELLAVESATRRHSGSSFPTGDHRTGGGGSRYQPYYAAKREYAILDAVRPRAKTANTQNEVSLPQYI